MWFFWWCFLVVAAMADDPRTWTDTAGRTLDGVMIRQDAAKVWVRRTDGREVAIEKSRLSPGDLEFLRGQPAGPPAKQASAPAGGSSLASGSARPGQSIFKSMKVDRSVWESSADVFHAGGVAFTQRLRTPHTLIFATEKVKPDMLTAYGEATERTVADCVRDLPGLAPVVTEKRQAIFILDSEISQRAFGNWLRTHRPLSPTWDRSGIVSAPLSEETCDPLGVRPYGRGFRIDRYSTTNHRTPDWPIRVHFLTTDLIHHYLADVRDSEPEADGSRRSFHLLRVGYAFFKEWQVAGKIETELMIGSASIEGFQNGRRWADAVRKVLKNPAGRPSLEKILKTPATSSQPMDVACAFGMMQFFNADPSRFRGFDQVLRDARENKSTPTTEEFAKAIGYESPAAFDTAWVAFMSSDGFK